MKQNKGITLIALVITIIVLLILAGVAIAMLSGQNGVMNRASEARYENVLGSVNEQVKLATLSLKTTITANMISKPDYVATGSDASTRYNATNSDAVFGALVKEVAQGLSADSSVKTEGYSVMGYVDTEGNTQTDGYGFIYITYSDNSLRSSLPTNTNDANIAINQTSWLSSGVKYNTKGLANKQDANEALVAYVIEVTNYDCTLLGSTSLNTTGVDAVLTTHTAASGDFTASGKTTYASTSISSILKTTKVTNP